MGPITQWNNTNYADSSRRFGPGGGQQRIKPERPVGTVENGDSLGTGIFRNSECLQATT